MSYVFMSFSSKTTRKNIGCCIIRNPNQEQNKNQIISWIEECERLGLKPEGADDFRAELLGEAQFLVQGMELNRFYTREQMLQMAFETV